MRQWLATQEVIRRLWQDGDSPSLHVAYEILERIEHELLADVAAGSPAP